MVLKKTVGINTKAQIANERKKAISQQKRDDIEKAKEDKKWEDNDKHIQAIQNRKLEAKLKVDTRQQKKQELKDLEAKEEKELASLKSKAGKSNQQAKEKLTRAEIAMRLLKNSSQKAKFEDEPADDYIEENFNIQLLATEIEARNNNIDFIATSGIDNALSALNIDKSVDKHPEKRRKAAYLAYEDKMMPLMRSENPTLKRSQLKELIWKMWATAAENPYNG